MRNPMQFVIRGDYASLVQWHVHNFGAIPWEDWVRDSPDPYKLIAGNEDVRFMFGKHCIELYNSVSFARANAERVDS